jgi:hypothetical protein
MQAIPLYVGMDAREQAGLHVFIESVWKHTSLPVNLTVLTPSIAKRLNIGSDGTNAFSTLRFAVPEIHGAGWAIFMDGADMLCRGDLAELWHLCTGNYAVKVVKHPDYSPKEPRKYLGTTLEADNASYPRKNWSSVVLWNCGHWAHFRNRDKLLSGDGKYLHRFGWLEDREIGEIPKEWNHLVSVNEPNPIAKLVHYTHGIPGFEHYRHSEHAVEWQMTLKDAARGIQYLGK